MKILAIIVGVIVVLGLAFVVFNNYIYEEKQAVEPSIQSAVQVMPISHATMVLQWNGKVIYTDPVGGVEVFDGQPAPDLVLVTDVHGDHLSPDTLQAVLSETTTVIAPQAVVDLLPTELKSRVTVLANGQVATYDAFSIQAVPMYNFPETEDSRHVKGRGNGYIIESTGTRVYIAGDTAATPEMRALQDIDIAFVPMNLPFTMGVEEAADAVLDFKPKTVYPFHYRGQDGLADVGKFKELVNAGDPNIEVVLLNWYPAVEQE